MKFITSFAGENSSQERPTKSQVFETESVKALMSTGVDVSAAVSYQYVIETEET